MKFSIVVPSFQQAAFLPQCLDSLLAQRGNHVELEFIVIDGGSTDGSREIIERYADRLAYWVSEPDRGQTHALIKGFERATGDILGWLNADDVLLPRALEKVAGAFARAPEVDVMYGDMNWVDREGRLIKAQREIGFDLDILLWVYDYIPQPSTFWRRRVWQRSGGLDEHLECAMDYDLWLKFVKAGARFAHLPEVLSHMRSYPEQKNRRLRAVSDREDQFVRERFLGRSVRRAERTVKKSWHKGRRIVQRLAIGAYGWSRANARRRAG